MELQEIIDGITGTAKGILGKDLSQMQGFSQRQLEAIAQQAVTIKNGVLAGEIGPDMIEFFFDGLKKMTQNFVDTLIGLALVTAEKLWNALVDKLWEIVNAAT